MKGLDASGVEVDCFVTAPITALPRDLLARRNLKFYAKPARWNRHRHFGREPLSDLAVQLMSRALAQRTLIDIIAQRHSSSQYDLLYQFAQPELLRVRSLRKKLPPIVVHPEVHAAGELRFHRKEVAISSRCEPIVRRLGARALLRSRAVLQKRDLRYAKLVIAPSRHFMRDLIRDCGVLPGRIRVVPNPIDLGVFHPREERAIRRGPNSVLTLLFVSRISQRKGVEMVVELSRRISDLCEKVQIKIIGGRTLWSDYRPLLQDLDPRIAQYEGPVPAVDLPERYRSADALIQPSHYEPFGITVGEALASGLPVIASGETGAAEGISSECCLQFTAGDSAGLEAAVRALVSTLGGGRAAEIRALARSEAERVLSIGPVTARLVQALIDAIEIHSQQRQSSDRDRAWSAR